MYSQYGEDDVMFDFMPKKDFGLYIDIGAGKPVELSNTYLLYTMGWRGLLVEPSPILIPQIKEVRPTDVLYEGAILDYDGQVDMVSKDWYGVTEKSQLYYSTKFNIIENNHELLRWQVPCMTFKKLLETYPDFLKADFVSIDVEANEDAVLSTVDFNVFSPELICIESFVRGQDQRHRWEHFLKNHYTDVRTEMGNTFYKRIHNEL